MSDIRVSTRAPAGAAQPEGRRADSPEVPPPPARPVRTSGWTGGRITALVIGALLVFFSLGLMGAGGTALWADLSRRGPEGYVTTQPHAFSTTGSALVTERIELGNPGVDWLYSTVVLGEVRVRVTPTSPSSDLFVGIGSSADVDRYLAGVSQTVISDFWTNRLQAIDGRAPRSAPATQDFWVASATGSGTQTLTWDPANGSWTVVVMNAGGQAGVDVTTELGATMPSLIPLAIISLVIGVLLLIGGSILSAGAIRRSWTGGARTAM